MLTLLVPTAGCASPLALSILPFFYSKIYSIFIVLDNYFFTNFQKKYLFQRYENKNLHTIFHRQLYFNFQNMITLFT